MAAWMIWAAAVVCYAVFWAWYVGFGGPLTKQEVDAYVAKLSPELGVDGERKERFRAFLESDDGGEFFMVNLIRLQPGQVTPPGGGKPAPAMEVLEGYTGPFMRALFLRGGHPALLGRAAAGYLEEWGVEKNPGWTASGIIRYRSRRDLAELATDSRFAGIHAFKNAAMSNTLAFPIAPARLFFSPRIVVGLALALAASLATRLVGG
jgi:hypothetical protein